MESKFSGLNSPLGRGMALTLWSLTWVAVAVGQANPYPYFEVTPIAFAPRVEYAAGVGPFSLTTLDWNGDGKSAPGRRSAPHPLARAQLSPRRRCR